MDFTVIGLCMVEYSHFLLFFYYSMLLMSTLIIFISGLNITQKMFFQFISKSIVFILKIFLGKTGTSIFCQIILIVSATPCL